MKINVTLIRHGKTEGNLHHLYNGSTDENLCEIGIKELQTNIADGIYPVADFHYTSRLKRCIQTAEYIYPNIKATVKEGLQECHFGDFEGKGYDELCDNPDYQRFIDSNGAIAFPNGETTIDFAKRCHAAFCDIMKTHMPKEGERIVIVCHGGTIMAILGRFSQPNQDFFSWRVENAHGYSFVFDTEMNIASDIVRL